MTDEMAREVAAALLLNLISFHKGRRALARTPITTFTVGFHLTLKVKVILRYAKGKNCCRLERL
jgi:hypothetical protein